MTSRIRAAINRFNKAENKLLSETDKVKAKIINAPKKSKTPNITIMGIKDLRHESWSPRDYLPHIQVRDLAQIMEKHPGIDGVNKLASILDQGYYMTDLVGGSKSYKVYLTDEVRMKIKALIQ